MSTRLLFFAALAAGAAEPVPPGPVVELPPMIVEESSGVSWWYAQVGGTEYLSRCSRSLTRAYIQAEAEAYGRLRILIPETLLKLLDMPRVSLLLPLEMQRAADDAVLREMLRVEEDLVRQRLQAGGTERNLPAVSRLLFLPNLRLDDRDLSAVFTYLDERTFQAERLMAADDLLYYVLSRRTPMLPPWLIEGLVGIYRHTQLRRDQVAMRPLAWSSAEARAILQRDPSGPRTLLPPGELFSERVFLGAANQHVMRVATWRAQAALFVRWALDPQHAPAAAALWRFAEGAATSAVTEAWFRECFGFGYSDLRDRLSDYLPQALKEPLLLRPPVAPASVTFKLEPATREQVARLRGECERLEIPYVRRQAPQFLEHYIGQARRTLRRAYERGDRDPRLVAALGLCELDAGDPAAARPLLEAAAAAGVKRPRVHFERARLRWEAVTRDAPAQQPLPVAAIAPTIEAVRPALAGEVPLSEAFLLLAEAWLRSEGTPPAGDLQVLARGARMFIRHSALAIRLALLHLRAGDRGAAESVLTAGLPFVADDTMRARFQEVLQAVRKSG